MLTVIEIAKAGEDHAFDVVRGKRSATNVRPPIVVNSELGGIMAEIFGPVRTHTLTQLERFLILCAATCSAAKMVRDRLP